MANTTEEIFLSPSVVEGGITNIQFTASTVEEIVSLLFIFVFIIIIFDGT